MHVTPNTFHSYRRWLIAGVVAAWACLACTAAAAEVQPDAGPSLADATRVAKATGRDVLLLFSRDANDAATVALQKTLGESNDISHHSKVRDHRAAIIATKRASGSSTSCSATSRIRCGGSTAIWMLAGSV